MINWFNHCYPYTNFHELNLDWVIYTVKKGEADIKNFIGLNTIKYADPILWDITRQYEANTVVVDPTTGNAFISTKAVPYGTHINNEDYWTQIYNYADIVDTIREQIAYNEGLSTTATRTYSVGDLVFTNDLLYRVISPMIAGDSFVADSNVVKTTINDELLRLWANDSSLQDNIDAEATARENADDTLQDNIDAEATARENADGVLQDNIDAEATARGNADGVLQDNIDAEATARENADGVLQDNIDAEATARENADGVLQDNIDAEALARQQADDDIIELIEESELKIKRYKNCIVLGNSYASGTGSPEGYGIFHFIEHYFDNAYLYSGSGTSFVNYDGQHANDTFIKHLNDAINDTSFDNDTIDTILIVGAYGESRAFIQSGRHTGNTRELLKPALINFMNTVNQNLPNCETVMYVNAEARGINKIVSGGYVSFIYDTKAVDYVCYPIMTDVGITYLGWTGVDICYYRYDCFSEDLYHPNTEGYKRISNAIINTLNGGHDSHNPQMNGAIDMQAFTGTANSYLYFHNILTQDYTAFNSQYLQIGAGTPNLATSYVNVNIDEALIPPPIKPLNTIFTIPCIVEGTALNVNVSIIIDNNSMFLRIRSDTAKTYTSQYNTLMSMQLPQF